MHLLLSGRLHLGPFRAIVRSLICQRSSTASTKFRKCQMGTGRGAAISTYLPTSLLRSLCKVLALQSSTDFGASEKMNLHFSNAHIRLARADTILPFHFLQAITSPMMRARDSYTPHLDTAVT